MTLFSTTSQNDKEEEEVIDFNFPGTPYDVQQKLMTALFKTIENKQIGLFESPTGTGKTLSIICASLTWLSRNRIPIPTTTAEHRESNEDDPPWVAEQLLKRIEKEASDLLRHRARAYDFRVRSASDHRMAPSLRYNIKNLDNDDIIDDLFGDLSSDDEGEQIKCERKSKSKWKSKNINKYKNTNKSKNKNKNNQFDDVQNNNNNNNNIRPARIIFATRTHTQITQFISELRRTSFNPPSLSQAFKSIQQQKDITNEPPISVTVFGSRKQMCINESVLKLTSASAISERCKELTESSSSTTSNNSHKRTRTTRCEFHDSELEQKLRDTILVDGISDMEDVIRHSKIIGGCPYFAAKDAISSGMSDVIVVPYAAVLHEPTRKSLGLCIDDETIVIFDEAHNVTNAVRDMHGCIITCFGLDVVVGCLKRYLETFIDRLSSDNLYRIRQCLRIANGIFDVVSRKDCVERVVKAEDLVFEAGIDNVNIFELVSYVRECRLFKKLRGYVHISNDNANSKTSIIENQKKKIEEAPQHLDNFDRFLTCMCDIGDYGRVAIYPNRQQTNNNNQDARLHYFVVDSSSLFNNALRSARSILLLGGTLSPRISIKNGLLRDICKSRVNNKHNESLQPIIEFECDHVVPTNNVMTRISRISSSNQTFEFTHRNRGNKTMINELWACIKSIASITKGGIVIFFSSYELLEVCYSNLDCQQHIHEISNKYKSILKESKRKQTNNENIWETYQKLIHDDKTKGAILLGVMGGKLSEGMNFSDDLGRVVIMVGMPFANARNIETAQVLNNITDSNQRNEYLENECMTVVNQCVGRAVRHRQDYATILLFDCRFGRQRVMDKLPAFIKRDVVVSSSFDHLCVEIKQFFEVHDSN